MVTEVIMRGMPGGLQASNTIEAEKLRPFLGKEIVVKITQPRNLQFHRKYFALMGIACDMADTELNREQFRAYVTVGAGYCDFINGEKGLIAVPKSISFSAMDESEFNRLYQDSLSFICQTWVLDQAQINQIVEFL